MTHNQHFKVLITVEVRSVDPGNWIIRIVATVLRSSVLRPESIDAH